MNRNFNKSFDKIICELFHLYTKTQHSFDERCDEFIAYWGVNVEREDECRTGDERDQDFDDLRCRAVRNRERCVIIGQTSAGKSTLINAILRSQWHPTDSGRTTNCFVANKKSQENRTYLTVNNEEKSIDLLKDLINESSENRLPNGSSVDVFYEEWPFSNENLEIVDTPGIDVEDDVDREILANCKDADLIVLVIDSTSTITRTMKRFIIDSKIVFSKLNCVLVYNQWDRVLSKNKDKLKEQHKKDAINLLCQELNCDQFLADKRVFFLSAKDELKNVENIQSENDQKFSYFRIRLQTELKNETFNKRWRYLYEFYQVVMKKNDSTQTLLRKIGNELPRITVKLTEKLKRYKDLDKEIQDYIVSIFNEQYDVYIEESLNKINDKITPEEREDYIIKVLVEQSKKRCLDSLDNTENERDEFMKFHSIDITSMENSQESLLQEDPIYIFQDQYKLREADELKIKEKRIEAIFNKAINNGISKLKLKIMEIIKRQNDEAIYDQILAIEELFFPLHIDTARIYMDKSFINIILTMKEKIRVAAGLAIGVSTVVGAAGIATGGVAFGILIPVEIAVGGLVGLGVAGGAVGGAISGGTSTGVLRNKKRPFQFITKKDEIPIKEAWESYKKKLCECYSKFLKEIDSDLRLIFKSVEDEFHEIQKETNDIWKKMENFSNEYKFNTTLNFN